MVGVNAFAADTDEKRVASSRRSSRRSSSLVRGQPRLLQPPVESMEGRWTPAERAQVERMTQCLRRRLGGVGPPRAGGLIVDATDADELMLTGQIFDHQDRLRSFEIVAEVCDAMRDPEPEPTGLVTSQ